MSCSFETVTSENRELFCSLMEAHLRAGEDADTPQAMLEAYIQTICDLIEAGVLDCRIGKADGETAGFVLFTKDEKNTDFTELPGYGTVMELSVVPALRGKGYGKALVACAEELLAKRDVKGYYVCGYRDADGFWEKLGYRDSGEKATNEQPLWVKPL